MHWLVSTRRYLKYNYDLGDLDTFFYNIFFLSFSQVFTKTHGDRPDVPDILILFTDGNAHDKKLAQTQADFLKKKGVLVITIGAGSKSSLRIFRQELTKISSGPEYSLLVDFENIQYFAEKVFPIVCDYMKKKKL